jgi:hypothetical protein
MAKFVVYPTPLTAKVTLTPDGHGTMQLVGYTAPDGRQGQSCEVSTSIPNANGATIELEANGFEKMRLRGFLVFEGEAARLQVDDYVMTETPVAPPVPGPTPPATGGSPLDIINRVYATGKYNLATHEGCGLFTEACADALHEQHSEMWGHIAKDPGQNQYNGHAVDALMLLANGPGTQAGIYDIIYSSVSYEAKPVCNYVEPPNYDKWYYPANAQTMGAELVRIPKLIPRHAVAATAATAAAKVPDHLRATHSADKK